MDAMDIDQDASTAAKRKADELPAPFTTPEVNPIPNIQHSTHGSNSPSNQSKRFKFTNPFANNHNQDNQPKTSAQDQSQNKDDEGHTTSSSTSSPQTPSHKEVYRLALRDEFHALNRRLVAKRDEFSHLAEWYEDKLGLYEGLSDIVADKGVRSDLNDWIEILCVRLLDVFIMMEDLKKEVEAIERRLYFILFELGGWV